MVPNYLNISYFEKRNIKPQSSGATSRTHSPFLDALGSSSLYQLHVFFLFAHA